MVNMDKTGKIRGKTINPEFRAHHAVGARVRLYMAVVHIVLGPNQTRFSACDRFWPRKACSRCLPFHSTSTKQATSLPLCSGHSRVSRGGSRRARSGGTACPGAAPCLHSRISHAGRPAARQRGQCGMLVHVAMRSPPGSAPCMAGDSSLQWNWNSGRESVCWIGRRPRGHAATATSRCVTARCERLTFRVGLLGICSVCSNGD